MALSRRSFLGGAFAVLAAGRAPFEGQLQLTVPIVDELEVLFVTDGSVFAFAEPVRRDDLIVERGGPSLEDHRLTLAAEWGLSLVLRSLRGAEQRTVLLDLGYTPEAFANNIKMLEFDPTSIDAVVISHGHFDHFGGIEALLKDERLRPGTPLRVGGEEAFCERLRGGSGKGLPFGALAKHALNTAGMVVEVEPEPRTLVGHGFTTGQIPFVTNERPLVPTRMLPGRSCDRAQLDAAKRDLEEIQDDAMHELGVCYHLRDKGLIVLGACSHRGILNTVRQAQTASGVSRIHAIIGGFHLVRPQSVEQARETAFAMVELDPAYIVPGHCSGEAFIQAAEQAMPGKIIRPYVGSRFIFGAGH
jgi:7,8-dihydropterin-6-yl-methyl-4-(beta-D-ribofuranosyl)aminobenzene 5'-phosphate synthase